MSEKHTPGQWRVGEADDGYVVASETNWAKVENGFIVATQIRWADIAQRIPSKANARLIAAAPDLLGALSAMMTFFAMDEQKDEVSELVFDRARAAVRKAKGETTP